MRTTTPALLTCWLALLTLASAAHAAVDARVLGSFSMQARVTAAQNVPDEFPGQVLSRRWVISARGCEVNTCRSLVLSRQRANDLYSNIELRRTAAGQYAGTGFFYTPLSCQDRVYATGSRAPYTITLTIAGSTLVDGIRFARSIRATYLNRTRSDATPCPLPPTFDAATYTGVATSPLPTPPRASFFALPEPGTRTFTFIGNSTPTPSGGPIVSRAWDFGDATAGPADASTRVRQTHGYGTPGTYTVTLTVTDANGLVSSVTHTVVAPGPPAASFTYNLVGATAYFTSHSQTGIGGSRLVSWMWNFGDPQSGPVNNLGLRKPVHQFSAPGRYTVTLTVIDANGRTSTTRQTITVAPPVTAG